MDEQNITYLTPDCGPHCGVQNGIVEHCQECHDTVKDHVARVNHLHVDGMVLPE